MRLLNSTLLAAALLAGTAASVWGVECQYCKSGVVYCNVVQDYPGQYTSDAQEACEDDRGHLIDIHAFQDDLGECDGGVLSFRSEAESSEMEVRTAATATGEFWPCAACGNSSTCHELSDIGECHVGCQETFTLMAGLDAAIVAGSTHALADLVRTRANVEYVAATGSLRVTELCDEWDGGPVETIRLSEAVAMALTTHLAVPRHQAADGVVAGEN